MQNEKKHSKVKFDSQGKMTRHQNAKEKYKNYQEFKQNKIKLQTFNVLHCHQKQKQKPYIPSPGQYVVCYNEDNLMKTFSKKQTDHLRKQSNYTKYNKPASERVFVKRPGTQHYFKESDVQFEPMQNYIEIQEDHQQDKQQMHIPSDPIITKNLRTIVRKQDMRVFSPSAYMMKDIVDTHQEIKKKIQQLQEKKHRSSKLVLPVLSNENMRFSLKRPQSSKIFINAIEYEKVDNVENSKFLKNAIDYDKRVRQKQQSKKQSTFIPKSKIKNIKHISGYNTIVLSRKDIQKNNHQPPESRVSPFLYTNPNLQHFIQKNIKKVQAPYEKKGYFLPIDYYIFDEEEMNGQLLVEKYRDIEIGNTYGYSKWFFTDGNFEWRRCMVHKYDIQKERFLIQWFSNQTKKYVSRVNLRFENQHVQNFVRMVQRAERYRQLSQIYMKYNYMIDKMQSPTAKFSEKYQNMEKFIQLINNNYYAMGVPRDPIAITNLPADVKFDSKRYLHPKTFIIPFEEAKKKYKFPNQSLNALKEQVETLFVRTNHQIEFNFSLPYSEEKQEMFKGYLNPNLFVPIISKPSPTTNKKGCLNIPKIKFLQTYTIVCNQAHVANSYRLYTLQHLTKTEEEIEKLCLVIREGRTPSELNDYIMDWTDRINSVTKKIGSKLIETQDLLNAETSLKQKGLLISSKQVLDKKTKQQLNRFQFLLNYRYQLCIRNLFQNSCKSLNEILQFPLRKYRAINQLQSQAIVNAQEQNFEMLHQYQLGVDFEDFGKDQLLIQLRLFHIAGKIKVQPKIKHIFQELTDSFNNLVKELSDINTVRKREISSARPNNKLIIFQDLKQDGILLNARSKVELDLKQLQDMGRLFVKTIKKKFQFLLDFNLDNKKKFLKKANFEDFQNELRNLKTLLNEINRIIFPRKIRCGILYFDCQDIKAICKKKIIEIADQVYKLLIEKIQRENEKLSKEIDETKNKLKQEVSNLQQLEELRKYATQQLGGVLESIYSKINQIMRKMDLLSQMNYKINYDDYEKSWQIYSEPKNVKNQQEKCLRRMKFHESKYKEDLFNQQVDVEETIQNIRLKLNQFMMEGDIDKLDTIYRQFAKLGQQISHAMNQCYVINRRQIIVGLKQTDYKELQKIKEQFTPYEKVWGLTKNYQIRVPGILKGPLNSLDRDLITSEIQESWTQLFNLEKGVFKIIPHMCQLTKKVKKQYESFKPYLPLIIDLRNPDLRSRHIKRIAEITGIHELEDNSDVTLEFLLQRGIEKFKEEIRDISEIASKELDFEKILNRMKREWKEIKFKVVSFEEEDLEPLQQGEQKLKKAYLIKEVDKIVDKLDQDIVKTQAIISSPFIKFLESQVLQWRNYNLFRAQQTIELWIKTQRTWQYLQPIFSSKDIHKELPKESVRYFKVDKQWRIIMDQTQKQPNVMECCQSKFKDNFLFIMDQFDLLLKSLNQFLNNKRKIFPRFYFLSNEELISILSKARIVSSVQKHLNKCFEGINNVHYGKNFSITHIRSSHNQAIQLASQIVTTNEEGQTRPVQDWLNQLDKMSKMTLIKYTVESYPNAYEKCGQLVHLHQMLTWTSDVTIALNQQRPSLQKTFEKYTNKLLNLVRKIREEKDKLQFRILTVMVVLMVHNKDIIQNLINVNAQIDSFEWIAEMRYQLVTVKKENEIHVLMINTYQKYGWEYLGNQQRLVITPLTDRCYRTLMSALHMCLGGAPEGPAGTGKTETVKDLAKATAKHCVVFNCSDSLDIYAMAKFFRGLTSCGSWACFDQFNRIELQVLSVIAQQILTIQTAIMRDSLSRIPTRCFFFDGDNCQLDPTCAVFITMNPGYAGRTQLPDNLKALFRSVAMMIPNYQMITQILLYSYGFQKARELSIKITSSLKLASEQLSTQSHYDFGMRTVKSIISAAGSLKNRLSQQNQDILCVRSIKGCNIPKFTQSDIPLFQSIIKDLFPNTDQKTLQISGLQEKINQVAQQLMLVLKPQIKNKILQIYETTEVRHGIMIVGNTFSGKSMCIRILAKSVNAQIHPINPKAVPIKYLLGYVDTASNQWHDGITAFLFRKCVEHNEQQNSSIFDYNWLYFDGPVDAQWIESMNTLLDDNKKLCLSNGQTLKLANNMCIMFEVDNLQEASPATVSRCGMVYLQPKILDWHQFIQPWFQKLVQPIRTSAHKQFFKELFRFLLQPVVQYMASAYRPNTSIYCEINWLVKYLLNLFQALLLKEKTREVIQMELQLEKEKEKRRLADAKLQGKEILQVKKERLLNEGEKSQMFSIFILAVIWSFGSALDDDARKAFSKQFKHIFKRVVQINLRNISKESLPTDDSNLYEVTYQNRKWVNWHQNDFYNIPNNIQFHQINVPTLQSIRHTFILKYLLLHGYPVVFFGKTGTGKTIIIKSLCLSLDQNKFIPTFTALSATTSTINFQDSLESKLEKQKRRKGVYGPTIGLKNIIFVDDLNMPIVEKYGAQPPLELLRQWFGYKGWYDKNTIQFKIIQDVIFTGAMGMNRPAISNRLLRNFNLIYIAEMQDQTLRSIIKKLLEWGFVTHSSKIKDEIRHLCKISINLHKLISKEFMPLPKKSHYLFNMRDLMKVIQGVISVPNSYYCEQNNRKRLLRLLIHQAICVYADRLCERADKIKFFYSMNNVLLQQYHLRLKQIMEQQQITSEKHGEDQKLLNLPILFGNYTQPHSPNKNYILLPTKNKLSQIIMEYISEYNQLNSKKINIVLFDDAINMLTKINRIMQQPFGHGLFIGIGGNGVMTLTKLATYMQDLKLFELDSERQISYNEWIQTIKNMLKRVGLQKQKGTLLITQSQIRQQKFIQDINNLLNIGEIPNSFNNDEKEFIISQVKDEDQKINITYMQAWQLFVNRSKINLHIVISLSPIGQQFRRRLRNFPSLVSCTSCVWVFPWSESALIEVSNWYFQLSNANRFIEKIKQISRCCVEMHIKVEKICEDYLKQQRKYMYVTPVSFIKMLNNFIELYQMKNQKILENKNKYVNGVQKLNECKEVVDKLKEELEKLKPVLIEKTIQTEEIMKKVDIENKQTQKYSEDVKKDQQQTADKTQIAENIRTQCQQKLNKALPELRQAIAALKTLTPKDFTQLKTNRKPTPPIRLTLEALMIMLDKKLQKPRKGLSQLQILLSAVSKELNDPKKFVKKLEDFKIQNVTQKVIDKLTAFRSKNQEFKPSNVQKASLSALGLCKWVIAMYNFYFVNKTIEPLRAELVQAQKAVTEAKELLAKKRALLNQVLEKLRKLTQTLEHQNNVKKRLKDQINQCEVKMQRAFKLTNGLSGEKIRWEEEIGKVDGYIEMVPGNILLASGFMSYLVSFIDQYRQMCLKKYWIPKLIRQEIKCDQNFSLINTIGINTEIQQWTFQGLPLDKASQENAITIKNTTKWPLILDPQGQALKWVKKMESKIDQKHLMIIKPNKDLQNNLEMAVRSGSPLIIHSVQETLDPILEPVLLKNIQKSSHGPLITIGTNTILYDYKFKLYLFTNLPNPHYRPELLTKITYINFMLTKQGLKDQMLSLISRQEDPNLEEEKIRIMMDNAENMIKLAELQEKILQGLSTIEGKKILEDEKIVLALSEAKQTAIQVEQRMNQSILTEERINKTRTNYEFISLLSSNLFFKLMCLNNINYMYWFGLDYYCKLFKKGIKNAQRPVQKNIKQRTAFIETSLIRQIYSEISKSLFVKDKLIFSFICALNTMECNNNFKSRMFSFFLNQMLISSEKGNLQNPQNPSPQEISEKTWETLCNLSRLEEFIDLTSQMTNNLNNWLNCIKTLEYHYKLPQPFDKLDLLSILCFVKICRPQLVTSVIKIIINRTLKTEESGFFTTPPLADLSVFLDQSNPYQPIMFLLMPGDDPQQEVKQLAATRGMELEILSLGKGQGPIVEQIILKKVAIGGWVMLQNCHLGINWLPRLQEILEEIQNDTNKKDKIKSINYDFRLIITTMQSQAFPMGIIQKSIKITRDPSKGIKSNLLSLYLNQNSSKNQKKFYYECKKDWEWKRLYMSLSFFHAIIRERRRFGPTGWNIYYDFNNNDFKISSRLLKNMLENYDHLPLTALKYLIGQCYYGGKVTDQWDRKLIKTILQDFLNDQVIGKENYYFSKIKKMYIPKADQFESLEDTIMFIEQMEDLEQTELFGLHPNSNISSQKIQMKSIISSLISLGSIGIGSSMDKNEIIIEKTSQLLKMLPQQFKINKISEKFQFTYYQCMNIVLIQELLRYNALIKLIKDDLKNLVNGLQGIIAMNTYIEQVSQSIYNNLVPKKWQVKGYSTRKSLYSYHNDLIKRIDMFDNWIKNGIPKVIWISGFYFTQSFFTGIKQQFSRKFKIPIDKVTFKYEVMDMNTEEELPKIQIGCYINGLKLQSASWNYERHSLTQSKNSIIFQQMSIIKVIPCCLDDKEFDQFEYLCPMYKTTDRKGTLSTTGHSTNFVISIQLRSEVQVNYWIKRGVALFTQLDD